MGAWVIDHNSDGFWAGGVRQAVGVLYEALNNSKTVPFLSSELAQLSDSTSKLLGSVQQTRQGIALVENYTGVIECSTMLYKVNASMI